MERDGRIKENYYHCRELNLEIKCLNLAVSC